MSTYEIIEFDELEDEKEKEDKPADIGLTLVGFFSALNYKALFFLFLIFIFLTSDVFVDKFLDRINGAVTDRTPNTKGTIVQGVLLVLFFIIMSMVIDLGYI